MTPHRGQPLDRGLLITFEGPEGSGKSTLIKALAEMMASRGEQPLVVREPGGSDIGERIRNILLDTASEGMCAETELLLMEASRAQLVREKINPALEAGMIILCDRFADASVAYQGVGRGLGAERIEQISMWATGGLRPDLTVVLDVDPVHARTRETGPADRLESEPLPFHHEVRQAFLDLAARDPDRYLVLDASLGIDDLHQAIRRGLTPLLAADGPVT